MDILLVVKADLKGASVARQKEVADRCGIPWSTLRKIVDGDTPDPRNSTMEKLRNYYLSPRDRDLVVSIPQTTAHGPPRHQMT